MKQLAFLLITIALLSMEEHAGRYPLHVFYSPVNRNIRLSGTFGELRSNHFHAGLDIKSENGLSGDPVYASSDGYISRIKVEEYGYGNVLYIDHPNGFTTVYAHLDRFMPEIDEYVKREQYKAESFEVDLEPAKDRFPIRQSQQVAYMGNTGASLGPHLHFEIRHTRDQVPVNPLHFGFNVADSKSPVIQQLIVYEYDDSGHVVASRIMQPKYLSTGKYGFDRPIELGASKASFSIRAYDSQDGSSNQNGVYSIQSKVDAAPSFAFTFDEIPFEQSRYLNAHIDYSEKISDNKYFHRCHPLEGNKLPIYYTGVDKGIIHLSPDINRRVNLDVADFNGNISNLSFDVRRNPDLALKQNTEPPHQTIAVPDQLTILSKPGIQVVWPQGSFYEKTPLNIDVIPADGLEGYSPHYAITPTDAPVHYYFDVNIEGLVVPARLHDKVFIARCDANGGIVNCGGTWIGNNLSTGVREISTYTIMADTIPPTISNLHFSSNMTGWSRMAFRISDNYRTRDKGRDLLYDAWVDGQWILMALDGKTGILTHLFDGHIAPGQHQLILKVTDDRGNETVLERTFTL